ncbi:unnamed protein product [Adineta steineri]|uniref:protein-tyrosine-phosphatase n=1 Tax=Adineta steineri TaxID=433720 RepID=A0A814INE7_9BILA|nr:unnamed protein product [Adineta steineri]CAF1513574.1 unnamed protein product [Adineta steineri]
MEKKNGDDDDEGREQLTTLRQNKCYPHRSLTNCTSVDYQINKISRRQTTIDNDRRYPPIILPSERLSLHMNSSSTLQQYTSNPSLINTNYNQQTHDEESTTSSSMYPFRHKTNKMSHSKSHNELYQQNISLSLSPIKKMNNNENELKHSSDLTQSITPLKSRTTTTVINSSDVTQSSPSHKIPLWKRFKKMIVPKKRKTPSSKIPTLFLDELSDNESNQTVPDSARSNRLQNPIKLSELKTWINSKTFPEQQIRAEYDKLPTESLHPKTIAMRPENKIKNRFNCIEPYDHSRVILRTLPHDSTSDYINASYIDGYKANKFYIAAQAPTDTTLYDFIRMIWQLRIQSIIMLTRLFEDGKHKCLQYWPNEGEKQINNFKIRIDNEEKYAYYIIRRFMIFNQLETSEVLIVKQFHFLSWPDHDCLSIPTPLLEFRQRFRTDYKKSSSPILVHCSAGVGRSGTFIALDALLEMIQSQDMIDILEFTYRMRQNRVYMIQTVDQYVFLYRTLIEGILTMNTNVSLQEFMVTRKVHMDMKDQYKLLEQLQSSIEFSYRAALDPANIDKNRVESILASDNSRPYLMTQVEKTTDYINAVFVNSYRQTSNYIITQYPLPHTLIDFWRLIYDHNISLIMLIDSIPHDSKTIPYWPLIISQIVSIGPFEIVLLSQKEDDYLIERTLEMKYLNKNSLTTDRTKTIRQFQVKDNTRLLPIVKRFLKEMRARSEQNVILQCLNGVTWSGYFTALSNSIDKMQTEQIIDPFKSVRLLRTNRKQFIDQNQYENLFVSMIDYAQEYLSNGLSSNRAVENSVYMNASGKIDQSSLSSNKR